jgi:signal transduction histidine kinase
MLRLKLLALILLLGSILIAQEDPAVKNFRLAENAFELNIDSTLQYLTEVRKSSNAELLFKANILEGQFLFKRRNYEGALEKFLAAEKQNNSLENSKYKAIVQDEISRIYGAQGKYDEAFKLKESALETFKSVNDSSAINKCLLGIAKLFNDRNDYQEANRYITDAIDFANNPKDLAFAIANKGIYFKHQNEFDSARYYYQKGIDLYQEDPAFLMRSYYNLALLEKRLKNIPEALNYYDKAIELMQEMKDTIGVAVMEVNRTFIYYDLKEFEKAESVLNQHAETVTSKGTIQNKLDFWLIRYNISEKLGKASDALSHYRGYRKIKDSLDNLQLNTKIAEFETKYETAEKEREIAVKDQQILRASNQRKMLLGGLAAVLWLGTFGVLYFWSRNRFNKQLAAKKIENLEQEKQLMAISSMLEGQEVERSRIAQDLHDSIGGLLTTVKVHFGVIQKEIEKISNLEIGKKVEELIDEASTEVRRISHKMSPRTLQINGLRAALNDAAMELNTSSDIQVDFEWNGSAAILDENKEIVIYRIVQELMSNALKHAQPSELLIQVNVFEGMINLLVEDDGIGFDYNSTDNITGLGLPGIISRVEFLQGTVNIDTEKDKGTTISIDIPIDSNKPLEKT